MKFKPVSNYILVKPTEVSNTTKSGLVLPESSLDKPNHGDVIEVGQGQADTNGIPLPLCVTVGNKVLFPKYAGTEIVLDGIKHLIMRDTDVFGIIE